jgi:hypothetical protein
MREPGIMKMNIVDVIPADCCRKRRRPTMATQRTERCSDGDLSEIVVLALGDYDESDSGVARQDDYPTGTPCSTPPAVEMEEMMDLSMEELLRGTSLVSTSSSRLAALLEHNQRALQKLVAKEEAFSKSNEDTTSEECCVLSPPKISWKEAWQFEVQHSLPGVAAMTLYCVAHAATYEFVSNLAYGAVEWAPDEPGKYSKPWGLYTAMLLLGCVLARFSGTVWYFSTPLAYQRVKLVYHNRIRLGAKDARCLHWLQQHCQEILGMVNLVSYYLCYIAVVFFVGQFAMLCDQREDILAGLPSTLYRKALGGESAPSQLLEQNVSARLVPLESDDLAIFGPEDDLYFFRTLSSNSYDNFFGQDYETALFDSTHHILFFASLAAAVIFTLKASLGYSFWAGW